MKLAKYQQGGFPSVPYYTGRQGDPQSSMNQFSNKMFDMMYQRHLLNERRAYEMEKLENQRAYNKQLLEDERAYNRGVLEDQRAYNRDIYHTERRDEMMDNLLGEINMYNAGLLEDLKEMYESTPDAEELTRKIHTSNIPREMAYASSLVDYMSKNKNMDPLKVGAAWNKYTGSIEDFFGEVAGNPDKYRAALDQPTAYQSYQMAVTNTELADKGFVQDIDEYGRYSIRPMREEEIIAHEERKQSMAIAKQSAYKNTLANQILGYSYDEASDLEKEYIDEEFNKLSMSEEDREYKKAMETINDPTASKEAKVIALSKLDVGDTLIKEMLYPDSPKTTSKKRTEQQIKNHYKSKYVDKGWNKGEIIYDDVNSTITHSVLVKDLTLDQFKNKVIETGEISPQELDDGEGLWNIAGNATDYKQIQPEAWKRAYDREVEARKVFTTSEAVPPKVLGLSSESIGQEANTNSMQNFYESKGKKLYSEKTGKPYRTERHNNPTAFTTDLAKQAGLVEGVDYEIGDAFYDVGDKLGLSTMEEAIAEKRKTGEEIKKYNTARIKKDDWFEVTKKLIDKVGFYDQNGGPRWSYIDKLFSGGNANTIWNESDDEGKLKILKKMYGKETPSKYGGLFEIRDHNKSASVSPKPTEDQGIIDKFLDKVKSGLVKVEKVDNADGGATYHSVNIKTGEKSYATKDVYDLYMKETEGREYTPSDEEPAGTTVSGTMTVKNEGDIAEDPTYHTKKILGVSRSLDPEGNITEDGYNAAKDRYGINDDMEFYNTMLEAEQDLNDQVDLVNSKISNYKSEWGDAETSELKSLTDRLSNLSRSIITTEKLRDKSIEMQTKKKPRSDNRFSNIRSDLGRTYEGIEKAEEKLMKENKKNITSFAKGMETQKWYDLGHGVEIIKSSNGKFKVRGGAGGTSMNYDNISLDDLLNLSNKSFMSNKTTKSIKKFYELFKNKQ